MVEGVASWDILLSSALLHALRGETHDHEDDVAQADAAVMNFADIPNPSRLAHSYYSQTLTPIQMETPIRWLQVKSLTARTSFARVEGEGIEGRV